MDKITRMPKLESLSIICCLVTNKIFKMVGKNCSNLQEFKIQRRNVIATKKYKFNGDALRDLSEFVFLNLNTLSLNNFDFLPNDFEYFNYFSMPKLKYLNLFGCNLNEEALEIFEQTEFYKNLKNLKVYV